MISDKIKSREEISKIAASLKKSGKIIGFTSGSFDILHAGHVSYLEIARQKCDCLIAGINSDLSVRSYKPGRPIIPESERIKLVAALSSVDYAFLFDERRNKNNIESIKPDLYVKAGDYKEDELTSRDYLKPWNGRVLLIPVTEKVSSSGIIKKIQDLSSSLENAVSLDIPVKPSLAVFLDRDGTINEDISYLHEPEKLKILPNVFKGLKKLQDMQYKLVIITNQGGIGLGYYTKEDFFKVNSEMLRQFSKNGIMINKIYFCPHSLSDNCNCRKPKVELFNRAKHDLNIDMEKSFTIGDTVLTDILAGQEAKTATILLHSDFRNDSGSVKPDYTARDMLEAAELIENLRKNDRL